MAQINPYFRPAEQPIIDQFVPMPFNEMYHAGTAKQAGFDQTREDASKLADMMKNVNARPGHEPVRKELEDKYYGQVQSVADDLYNKGDYRSANYKLRNLAREWQTDPTRQGLESSYQNYLLYQKDKIAKGDKYAWYEDPELKYKPTINGKLNPYQYTGMGELEDHQKRAEDMMNNIKASGSEDYKMFDVDPNTGNISKVKSGYEGIASKRVMELAQNKVADFIDTKEGKGWLHQFKAENPEATNQAIKENATRYLYNAGSNQIFGKSSVDKDFSWGPSDMRKDAKDKANMQTPNTHSEFVNTPLTSTMDNVINSAIFKDGKLDGLKEDANANLNWSHISAGGSGYSASMGRDALTSAAKNTNAISQGLQSKNEVIGLITNLRNNYQMNGTDEKVLKDYQNAIKSFSQTSVTLNPVSNEFGKEMGQQLSGDLLQRNMYLYDGHGKTELGKGNEVMNVLGLKEADFKKQLQDNGITGIIQGGDMSGAFYSEVTDGSGNTRRVIIQPTQQQQAAFSTSTLITKKEREVLSKGDSGDVVPMPHQLKDGSPGVIVYHIRPTFRNGEVSFDLGYSTHPLDAQGQPILSTTEQSGLTSMNEIMEAETANWPQAGFLGSNTTVLKPHTAE